jgi:uncharacterized OB-fold protein
VTDPKPIPVETRWSAEFWAGLSEGRFLLQRCNECQQFAGYPKVFCPHCHADALAWVEAAGTGTIYTFTTVVANPPSTFISELPYTIAIIELAEGVRFLSRLANISPGDVRCELPVKLLIQPEGDRVMPFFEPA